MRRKGDAYIHPIPFLLHFFLQYNVVKKWLEVEIAPDIRGRIPLLLMSLSFKVSVCEILERKPRLPKLDSASGVFAVGTRNHVLTQGLVWAILGIET